MILATEGGWGGEGVFKFNFSDKGGEGFRYILTFMTKSEQAYRIGQILTVFFLEDTNKQTITTHHYKRFLKSTFSEKN